MGYQNVETNAHGRVLRVLERFDPKPGTDLTLHLDINVQRAAVEALGDRRGAVVAMDPLTGGVLALVSTPGFDTNLFVNGISSAITAPCGTLSTSRCSTALYRASIPRARRSSLSWQWRGWSPVW